MNACLYAYYIHLISIRCLRLDEARNPTIAPFRNCQSKTDDGIWVSDRY